ncbi:MAG: biosynthetic arginine decarboxylase [Gammaproteobacteria bacterium]|nr:biosynthetic arginine decarboxylase [Gammaproteobacteria bacterium]
MSTVVEKAAGKPVSKAAPSPDIDWSTAEAAELYRVDAWSDGFFRINEAGHVAVTPLPDSEIEIDLPRVVEDIRARNVSLPALIRFQDILQARVRRLNEAFREAIADAGYRNRYRGVYPIKVNQLHEVVEEVLEAGRPYGMGLECGSKAELVAALPHLEDDDALLVCNGVKDVMMLRSILAAQRLGKQVIPVVEKFSEFEEIMRLGAEMQLEPRFGARIRLATEGSGRWEASGGDRSKFGLSLPELVTLIERLENKGSLNAFVLLHFHLGSQIADIQILKSAVKEIAQCYAQLLKRNVPIRYLDVGGGLGVSHDAPDSPSDYAVHYSLQEYANAVVFGVREVCEEQDVEQPVLISESGRAMTAHHSVLVVEVLGAYPKDFIDDDFKPGKEDHVTVHRLFDVWNRLKRTKKTRRTGNRAVRAVDELLEAYHDAIELRRDASARFGMGYLPLEQKALTEQLFWSASMEILTRLSDHDLDVMPPEFQVLEEQLAEHYLCDFSVFQSIIDHWAIGQSFPILPIDRLDERPTRRAVLVDLTCDSDGKVSHYVSSNPDKRFIELHRLRNGEPYYLGFFMMGAYQDIMGDAHNLFGRVAEAHVYADAEEPGGYYIEKILPAMTIEEMLASVQYFPNDLQRRMNQIIRQKVEAGVIRPRVGTELLEQYMRHFSQSTYVDAQGTPATTTRLNAAKKEDAAP